MQGLGMLEMTDEAGEDAKVLAVPIDKLCSLYRKKKSHDDLPDLVRSQIAHFSLITKIWNQTSGSR